MAQIEIMGNPIREYEKVQEEKMMKEKEGRNFWEWELKILREEQQHFKDHLDKL
jgi:hypothetical protein